MLMNIQDNLLKTKMDLESKVSFIKMRIEKFKRTYKLNTDPSAKVKLFEKKEDDHESYSEKLRKKFKVQ